MKIFAWFLTITGMMLLATGARAQDDPEPPASEATSETTPNPEGKTRPQDPFATSIPGKADPFAGEIAQPVPHREEPKNLVMVNLLGALDGNYQLDYQRAISSRFSLVLSPSLRRVGLTIVPGLDFNVQAIGVLAGLAFYFPQKALKGFNMALSGGVMHLEAVGQHQDTHKTWNAKATLGYRYIFNFGLSLEINVGALLMPEITLYEDTHRVVAYVNGGPVAEIGLGWVF